MNHSLRSQFDQELVPLLSFNELLWGNISDPSSFHNPRHAEAFVIELAQNVILIVYEVKEPLNMPLIRFHMNGKLYRPAAQWFGIQDRTGNLAAIIVALGGPTSG